MTSVPRLEDSMSDFHFDDDFDLAALPSINVQNLGGKIGFGQVQFLKQELLAMYPTIDFTPSARKSRAELIQRVDGQLKRLKRQEHKWYFLLLFFFSFFILCLMCV